MKYIFSLFLGLLIAALVAQKERQPTYPQSISRSFHFLDSVLNDTMRYTIVRLPENVAVLRLYDLFGIWIGQEWLQPRSSLSIMLTDSGHKHTEIQSLVLLRSYHRYSSNRPLRISEQNVFEEVGWQVDTSHENHTTRAFGMTLNAGYEELLKCFPTGDTIVFNDYGTELWETEEIPCLVMVVGEILKIENGELTTKVLKVDGEEGCRVKTKKGGTLKTGLMECFLLPPPGWTK
ncbi:MAG: DUF6794 domain-containing protein [Owenweeksia sp.]